MSTSDSLLTPPSSDSSSFVFPSEDSTSPSDGSGTLPSIPHPSTTPPAVPNPPKMATTTTTISYRVGDVKTCGTKTVRFSGGGMHPINHVSRPASSLAMRPDDDLRSIMRVEDASIKKPLEEVKRIDEGPSSTVAFSTWLNDIKIHMTYHGMDSIAYVLVPQAQSPPITITRSLPPSQSNGIYSSIGAASLKSKLSGSTNSSAR
jgi:hypothetical protein